MLNVTFSTHDRLCVTHVAGQVDAANAGELSEAVSAKLSPEQPYVVLDLSQLDYTSSAGLRALLAITKQARALGGDVRLAAVQDKVGRVLTISGFSDILRSYPTVDEAVASLAS